MCPLREADVQPPLELQDAGIRQIGEVLNPDPTLTVTVIAEESFLELTPWAIHEYLPCEE